MIIKETTIITSEDVNEAYRGNSGNEVLKFINGTLIPKAIEEFKRLSCSAESEDTKIRLYEIIPEILNEYNYFCEDNYALEDLFNLVDKHWEDIYGMDILTYLEQ